MNKLKVDKFKKSELLHDKLVFSMEELSGAMGVSKPTLYKEVKEGRLKVSRLGGRKIFLPKNIRKWLNKLPTGLHIPT